MTLHLPTLNFTLFTILVASACMLTLFGISGRIYRGYWWWTGAQWLLAFGLLANTLSETYPPLIPVTSLLLLQWPIVVLAGVRRFYVRHAWRLPMAADWLLLGGAFGIWLAAWASQGAVIASITAFCIVSCALLLYSAAMLTRLLEFRTNTMLKALAAAQAIAAALLALHVVLEQANLFDHLPFRDAELIGIGMALVMAAFVMVYFCLQLTHERTEANLRLTQQKLRVLANTDTLTRVFNRRRFHELASQTLGSVDASRAALMTFDIDHFKQINDRLGHAVGDEALRQVGRCTRDTLRELDVAGRLGGDEFAVLLPDTSVADAMSVASRIVEKLDQRQVAPSTAALSLSFGVVQLGSDESIAEALRRADQALYEAKRQGRSCAVSASGDEDRPVFAESQRLGLTSL